jgi:hypothetical protein
LAAGVVGVAGEGFGLEGEPLGGFGVWLPEPDGGLLPLFPGVCDGDPLTNARVVL